MKTLKTISRFKKGQWDNTVTLDINDYNDVETAHICVKSIGTIYSTYTTILLDGYVYYGAFDTYNMLPNGVKKYIETHQNKWIDEAKKLLKS